MTESENSLNFYRITHTFITGKSSTTIIIPKPIAVKHGLDKPTDIIIEDKKDGLLIKKLRLSVDGFGNRF